MSRNERDRIVIMTGIKRQELTLVQAASLLELSYRQTKRVWGRYRAESEAGLGRRLRGTPSLCRQAPEVRERMLARYEERYPDFGPTLAAEYLEAEGLKIDHETLRRWLMAEGKRAVRRRQRHRQWREHKACFGQMVQLAGSHPDWFEGRRTKCVLMVMVDNATGRMWAQFFEEETTRASHDVLESWVCRHGSPRSLYVDRDSIHRCGGLGSVAEQLAGKAPQTQFGRAMAALSRAKTVTCKPSKFPAIRNTTCSPPNGCWPGLATLIATRMTAPISWRSTGRFSIIRRVKIIPADTRLFQRGVDFFEQRQDKEWFLTDCLPFVVMREEGIAQALTGDKHFEQAGFTARLK